MSKEHQRFVALAAVAWADGRMSKNEAAGLMHAAQNLGLDEIGMGVVGRVTQNETSLDELDPEGMHDWEKLVTYALACWLARVDGIANAEELDSLRDLGFRLGIDEHKQHKAASAVSDVAILPGGHRPEKFDFARLIEVLREKLPTG